MDDRAFMWMRYVSENSLASTLIAAILIGAVGGLWRLYRNARDSKRIYEYLVHSASNTDYVFRSTQAISTNTRIPESRVVDLCIKHPNIKRNEKEKQSWRLADH
uniref:hypothetical protein n=1 Tax=Hylemonella sp. TaxID=2066020 RepID=UPI0035B02CC4